MNISMSWGVISEKFIDDSLTKLVFFINILDQNMNMENMDMVVFIFIF